MANPPGRRSIGMSSAETRAKLTSNLRYDKRHVRVRAVSSVRPGLAVPADVDHGRIVAEVVCGVFDRYANEASNDLLGRCAGGVFASEQVLQALLPERSSVRHRRVGDSVGID